MEVGTPLTYTVEFINNGPGTALDPRLPSCCPASITFVSPSSGCSAVQGTITCPVGHTALGNHPIVQIVVIPTVIGVITTTVRATSTAPDPISGNDVDTIVNTVVPVVSQQVADLAFVRDTSSPNPVTVGTPLTYSPIFVNNGPDVATDVTITYTLPIDIRFVSTDGCQQNGPIVTCSVDIPLGVGAQFEHLIVVSPTVAETITTTARVTSRTPDPNPANNVGTVVTTVLPVSNPVADLAFVSKTASSNPVTVGTPLTYSLNFVNDGPGTATNITVTDTLPAGVTFISASPGCSEAQGTVTCNFSGLGSGTRFGPTIMVIPTVVGTITNTALVTSTTPDPNPANNMGTAVTTVLPVSNPVADLAFVSKIASPDPVTVGTPLTYGLNFVNNGPSTATNITVTDTLPRRYSRVRSRLPRVRRHSHL